MSDAPALIPDSASTTGRCVVVTRPQPQADAWLVRLQAEGVGAIALPLLHIVPDPALTPALRRTWHTLDQQAMVMFVSPNAVQAFFAHRPQALAWPAGVLAGATGPGTVAALQAAGVTATAIVAPRADSDRFDAETLWTQVLAARHWAGVPVLIVRGESGRDWLADTLRGAGAEVQFQAAYRLCPPRWEADARACLDQVLAAPARHAWLFSSSQAVRYLVEYLERDAAALAAAQVVTALATHPRIAETVRAAGWPRVIAVQPDPAVVARAVSQ
ncbi:MAG: uroporphyrinogen-III synthase [Burkholderiales bacterium]